MKENRTKRDARQSTGKRKKTKRRINGQQFHHSGVEGRTTFDSDSKADIFGGEKHDVAAWDKNDESDV